MSKDKKKREIYYMRANNLRNKISELNAAKREGIEEVARNMKKNELSIEMISKLTGLRVDEIDKLQ